MVHHRSLTILVVVAFILIFSMASVQAGQPAKPGKPGLPECLAEVNQLKQTIADKEATIGVLQEQIDILQASLLDEMSHVRLPQTGQTDSGRPGDDGALQKGVPWPEPRFTDNGDGTVTDNLTRLIWLKNANCFVGGLNWYDALISSNDLETGSCGLTDNSSKGDWRLPNRNELLSLVYTQTLGIKIPEGHPFLNVLEGHYWTSSTSWSNFGAGAYYLYLYDASVSQDGKAATYNGVWPVRDSK